MKNFVQYLKESTKKHTNILAYDVRGGIIWVYCQDGIPEVGYSPNFSWKYYSSYSKEAEQELINQGIEKTNEHHEEKSKDNLILENTVLSERTYFNFSWDTWFQLVSLIERVDFPCDFKNNKCRDVLREREPWFDHGKNRTGGCCEECAENVGYISHIFGESQEQFDENKSRLVQLYDKENGFWRPNQGCILPKSHRGSLCNSYVCPTILEEYKNDHKVGLLCLLSLIYKGRISPEKVGPGCEEACREIEYQEKDPVSFNPEKLKQLLLNEGSISK